MTSEKQSETSAPKRRDLLRYLGLGVIASGFGLLFHRAWVNGKCIGHSQCGRCMANTKCELPLAIEFRKGGMPANERIDKHDHKQDHGMHQKTDEQTFRSGNNKSENRKIENG